MKKIKSNQPEKKAHKSKLIVKEFNLREAFIEELYKEITTGVSFRILLAIAYKYCHGSSLIPSEVLHDFVSKKVFGLSDKKLENFKFGKFTFFF